MNFGQFLSYYKRIKFIKKLYKNWELKTSSTLLLCLKRSKPNFFWKMKFFKQAPYIRYVIAKLSKFIQFDIPASWDSFYRGFFENWKEPGISFQVSLLVECFDIYIVFAILHKLAKFHYQTVFTFKLFREICFVFHAWAFDDIMTFEYLVS